jgi:TolB protein
VWSVAPWLAAGIAALTASGGAFAAGEIAFLGQTGGYWQVWVMGADGNGQRQVTRSDYEKARVSWFPDGRRLLVLSLEGQLFEVDVESGHEKQVPLRLGSVHDASVSADGQWLAVSAGSGGSRDNQDIWLARSDGSGERRFIEMPWFQDEPRFSRDGVWIYFTSGDGKQDHDVWRARVSNGSKEQLTVNARYHFELDLAPNGALAYSSNQSGDYELYTSAPDGTNVVRWTNSPGIDGHPSWSPDGQALVFHSSRGGSLNIWRQDGPKASARPLTHFAEGARDPDWWKGPQ